MRLGILGGSGVYALDTLESVKLEMVETPFGAPSDRFVLGTIGGQEVVFLARHGQGHVLLPSEINHRANIFGMKCLGVTQVVAISAVGSLQEQYRPRDIVLPDQYFDRTKRWRDQTFCGDGIVAHVVFGEPVCGCFGDFVEAAVVRSLHETGVPARPDGPRVSRGGVYVNMEGPAFSTRAESASYRAAGYSVIGMTSLPEAKLCREAGLCYQPVCMVTDYDCWHESEASVTVEMILNNLRANADLAQAIIRSLALSRPAVRECDCGNGIADALVSDPKHVSAAVKARLAPLLGKWGSD